METSGTNTMFIMGEHTSLEDLTVNMIHVAPYVDVSLCVIEFPGKTTYTSTVDNCVINLQNPDASGVITNVTGILFSGTRDASNTFPLVENISDTNINIFSTGNGEKRGILLTNNNHAIVKILIYIYK